LDAIAQLLERSIGDYPRAPGTNVTRRRSLGAESAVPEDLSLFADPD
jgi:hypothetical protein